MNALVLWVLVISAPPRYSPPILEVMPDKATCMAKVQESSKNRWDQAWCIPLIQEKK